jgi:transcription elongation GreA/GreB family factor
VRRPSRPLLPDKALVRAQLLEALERALATMTKSAEQTRSGVVHEDSRAEGDKDMRSTEQSYLARGQAMRAEDLGEQAQRFATTPLVRFADGDAIAPGALVLALVGKERRVFFLAMQGGGIELEIDQIKVTVVTPASPVGRALLGLRVGDELELPGRSGPRAWEIEAIG